MASSSICLIDTKFEGGKTSSFHSANPVVPVHTLNKKTYFINDYRTFKTDIVTADHKEKWV